MDIAAPSPGKDDVGREPVRPQVGRHGDRTAVWLSGEHDIATAALISTALVEAMAIDDADVVVDLADVSFMDASTIGVFAAGRELLGSRDRHLTVRSPQRGPRAVLELCGLAELIETSPVGPDGHGAATALETWVEVPPASRPANTPRRGTTPGPPDDRHSPARADGHARRAGRSDSSPPGRARPRNSRQFSPSVDTAPHPGRARVREGA